MRDMKDFYEDYWKYREAIEHLCQKRMPVRLKIACSMIKMDRFPLDVLDLGCGDGGIGMILSERYKNKINLFGIDISETALKIAQPYYNEVKQADIEKDDINKVFEGRKFDYAIVVEVLEHIFRPEKLIENLRRSLKPNGRLIVSFPNFAFYKNRLDVLLGHFPKGQHLYSDAEHIHYWTYTSFKKFLIDCGLQVEIVCGHFSFPFSRFLPESVSRFLGRKFPNFFGYQLVMKVRVHNGDNNKLPVGKEGYSL